MKLIQQDTFDNSLSDGENQNVLRQIVFVLLPNKFLKKFVFKNLSSMNDTLKNVFVVHVVIENYSEFNLKFNSNK